MMIQLQILLIKKNILYAFLQTVEKTSEVSENLKKLQDQMHCWDGMLKQWVADVKQWASSGEKDF